MQQVLVVLPFHLVAPAYFSADEHAARRLIQTAIRVRQRSDVAFSFFITVYGTLADLQGGGPSSVGFRYLGVAIARAVRRRRRGFRSHRRAGSTKRSRSKRSCRRPAGLRPLVAGTGIAVPAQGRTHAGDGLVRLGQVDAVPPSPASGPWQGPHRGAAGRGQLLLPQRPYFPVGTLAAAVTYPAEAGAYSHRALSKCREPSACRRWPSGSMRMRTGTACSHWRAAAAWHRPRPVAGARLSFSR